VAAVAAVVRNFGTAVYALAITSGVSFANMLAMTGDATHVYNVTQFTDAAFDAVLEPLLAATCLGESGTGATCPNCPDTSLCTTCASCVTCLSNDDCNLCQVCNLNTRGCTDLDISTACPFDAPTQCDVWVCNGTIGCSLERNAVVEASYQTECVNQRGGTWNTTLCKCDIPPSGGDGDGGTQTNVIVGSTVGAVGAAGAAALGTLVGGLVLCGLAALALVAALIAAVIIGAVLIAGLIVLAIVAGIGIAGLVMGIKMAIPPAIKGVEVAGSADISAMENPLSKSTEWVGSKVSGD